MATKARFYEVTLKNGHREWTELHAAPSKKHLSSAMINPDVNVVSIKPIGWQKVDARPSDESNDPEFYANVKGHDTVINKGMLGYKYLTQQLLPQVDDVKKFISDER
jgi:hypothetical protein